MNCDALRDNLVELAYDELEDPRRRQVLEHLARCPDCQAEYRKLRQARTALALHRGEEPAAAALRGWVAGLGRSMKARLWPTRWVAAVGGLAAMVAIALTAWLLWPTGTAAFAEEVQIEKLSVSLTILSEPEATPGRRYSPRQQPAAQGVQPQFDEFDGQFTYSGQMPPLSGIFGWQGLALVRDQRVIRNLDKGTTQVRFKDVPWAIKPDTVRLRSVDEPGSMAILEQNYQYDLASAAAVLKRYVDKDISVTFEEGEQVTGRLLSFDGGSLVVQPEGEGPRNISRAEVKAIRFAKLPKGLLTTPTLTWLLHSEKAARRRRFEVAYMTAGLSWRADYVLKLHVAAGKPKADEKGLPQIFDTADLVGYATVANHSGITYKDAQLKLMAGDVNLIQEQKPWTVEKLDEISGGGGGGEQFKEKSFFEYHLYTLGRPTTIAAAETKQIELISGSGIRLRRGYVYDRSRHATAVRVVSEFKNTEANGLGKPLPKGVIRLYAPDPTGVDTFISKTTIDHTPKGEKIRLSWAYAFDIAATAKRTNYRRRGRWEHHEDWAYSLRNHKDYDVTVTVHVRVPATTYKFTSGRPWKVLAVGLVEIDVPVKANTAEKLVFSYDYNTRSGGGLKTPGPGNR